MQFHYRGRQIEIFREGGHYTIVIDERLRDGDYFCPHSPGSPDLKKAMLILFIPVVGLCPVCHVHRRVVRPRRSRARSQPPIDRDPAQSAHPSIPDENLFMVIILHQIRGQSSQRFGCHRRLGQDPSVTVVPGIPHVAQLSASSGKSPWIRQLPSVGGAQGSSIQHPVILESPDGTDMEQLGPWS